MSEQGRAHTPISRATTPEQVGEFWDAHDLSDFEDILDVTDQFEVDIHAVRHLVALDPEVLDHALKLALQRGISVQPLVNLAVMKESALTSP